VTTKHREHFNEQARLARLGDERATKFLRDLAHKMADNSSVDALIKVLEAFNDAYTDEQIEYALNTRLKTQVR